MEVAGYFAIARRWWLVLAASALLAAGAGYVVASQLPKVYEAEARILVGPLNTDLNTQRAAGQLSQTYAQLVTSQRVVEAVIERLGLDVQSKDLLGGLTAVPNDVTRLVVIRVSNRDPQFAATLANAVADELGRLGAASGRPEGQTQVVDVAAVPTTSASPQVSLIVLLTAFAGLLAAIACVVLIEYFRDSVTSEGELRELSDAPILGLLPTLVGRRRDFASGLLSSSGAEAYRILSTRLEPSFGEKVPRTLLVADVYPYARAGTVAAGLALGFADRGIRTALIDANMESPDATRVLGLEPVPDLDRLVVGGQIPISRLNLVVTAGGASAPRHVELTVIPSGTRRDVGRVEHLEMMLDRLADEADVVVITSPPVDRSPEALLWARLVDATVLVVPEAGARRRDVISSVEALRLAGLDLAGTIMTDAAPRAPLRRRSGGGELPFQTGRSQVAREILAPREANLRASGPSPIRTVRTAGDPDA